MTLVDDDIFDYLIIKDDTYILKKDTPDKIVEKIKDYVYDMKTLYGQVIKIRGIN